MTKFKVGDRVRTTKDCYPLKAGEVHTVEQYSDGKTLMLYKLGGVCTCDTTWELVEQVPTVLAHEIRFILQYELDKDPFETFATMKEVEARIKELAKRSDLKRESIKVYEIAKTYDVSLETRIVFGPKVKLSEGKAVTKRGRPKGSKTKK
jgi:hypothetical protein